MLARAMVIVFSLCLFSTAKAQDDSAPPQPAMNSQRFTPAANFHDFLAIESGVMLPKGALAIDFSLSYAHRPLQMTGDGGQREFGVIEGLTSGHFRAGFGLAEWAQIDLRVPVMQLSQVGLIDTVSGNRVHFSLGDVLITSKMRLYKNDAGAAIAVIPEISLPTGRRALHLTYGVPTFGAKMVFSTWTKRFRASAHVGYRLLPGSAVIASVAVDDELQYGVGVGVDLARDLIAINLELTGVAVVGPARWNLVSSPLKFGTHSPLEVVANVQISTISGLDILIGGGVGLSSGAGTPAGRALLGVGWAPPSGPADDPDRDSVLVGDDQCPRQPEDLDGFEDDDGCPDIDNDQDGVIDRSDSCPDEPEDMDGFKDGDGCPELDNDLDGIADEFDRCPREGASGSVTVGPDGCPDDDLDEDGVSNSTDLCPNSLEDLDGFEDEDGCPDEDNDQDGIPDLIDVCPLQPEEFNGIDDDDGCPDSVKAIVRGKKIVILKKILFVTNRADIVEDSFEVLRAVRDALNQNPNILLLRVDGYTDSRGDQDHNLELSEARARSVMTWLIEGGVAPSRLEAIGFGEANPIDDNATEGGRQVNRRVEFSILETVEDSSSSEAAQPAPKGTEDPAPEGAEDPVVPPVQETAGG